jgi:pimeloyl-ACP methyl ester carboxylesterase
VGAPHLPAGFTDTFTSRFIDTGQLRLHAVTGGQGPPLLLVHGWPQTWYAWRMVMPTLAEDFQVIAVDQRGIGLSDKPTDGYDTATLAGDLVALMDALGYQRFALYGTDTGMPIAYALAADPEALRGSFEIYRAFPTIIAQNQQRATRRLRLPVLAIGGAESSGAMVADTMQQVADDVQGVVLADCGHWVAEQAPEQLLAALTAFLALAPYRAGVPA